MNESVLLALLNDLPAIISALKEAGQLTEIAWNEFQQFNHIVSLAQAGQLTPAYIQTLDQDRQTSFQNTLSALVSEPAAQ